MHFFRLEVKEGQLCSLFLSKVVKTVATLASRGEPSKDLVSQSLSSKLTCEREMAQKALGLLLTAQSAFERDQLTRLLNSCSQLRARSREREINSQGWMASDFNQAVLTTVLECFNSVKHCFSIIACFNSVKHCFSMC